MLAVALSLYFPANKHPTLLHIKHCEALWRELLASWIPGAGLALTSWALPSSPLKSQQLMLGGLLGAQEEGSRCLHTLTLSASFLSGPQQTAYK